MTPWDTFEPILELRSALGDRRAAIVVILAVSFGVGGVAWLFTTDASDVRGRFGQAMGFGWRLTLAALFLLVGAAVLLWAWRTLFSG